MRFSRFFAPTLKEAPKDATLPSHKFLIRGGYIEQVGSGLYNFLPLGEIVLNKIKNIVKKHMDASNALECSFSVVTPANAWIDSGRYEIFGAELLRFKDRKKFDFVLSPTNEESAVNVIKNKITSYKQLPINLYQINTKFRDEARPRFGLLRGREFIMKDAYSFHANYDDLDIEFNNMKECYKRIFDELELDYRIADANSGAIGGSGSKEFMVIASNGEDDIIICSNCEYCANVEAGIREKPLIDKQPPIAEKMSKFHTPNIKTIKELSEFFHTDEYFCIKAVIKKIITESGSKIVVFFIRGCDELQETKALSAVKDGIDITDASEEEIANAGIVAGFCGPHKLDVEFYIDNELKGDKNMIIGANELDYHVVGFSVVNFNEDRFKDLILVKEGDKCQKCGGELKITKGIEVGHIFKLGDKYSSAMNATFLDEFGKSKPFIMGCYGIGVSRLLATAIEASFDEKGCVFSKTLSPFQIEIIISNMKDEECVKYAFELYDKLRNSGFEVLIDDRTERFGVKMNDFELIGIYSALIVGKGLKNNEVEFIKRKNLQKSIIKADSALDFLIGELS